MRVQLVFFVYVRSTLLKAGLRMVCLFMCVTESMCSHISPTVDCKVTVSAQIPIVYLVEQAS